MPDGGLVIERPGSGQFMIECRGKAAHVGRDFTSGVSAVNALADCLRFVAGLPDPANGLIANIGPLEGGIAANVVPDRACAWGNVRFPTAPQGERLGQRLESLQTPRGALPAVCVVRSFNRPAKPLTPATEELARKARARRRRPGAETPLRQAPAACAMAITSRPRGFPPSTLSASGAAGSTRPRSGSSSTALLSAASSSRSLSWLCDGR